VGFKSQFEQSKFKKTINSLIDLTIMIQKLIEQEVSGFNVIDIGCRGQLNPKWDPIEKQINLHGFDPDQAECERLAQAPNHFKSVIYHPYAVAGHKGKATLYKTRSGSCYSLLKPNTQWLKRFSFHALLDVLGEEELDVNSLGNLSELKHLDLDVIKIDSQGLELEILKGATELLDQSIYAETESGFTPNYENESTQAEVDEYMRSKGFLLFDLILSRMPLDNMFKNANESKAMLLWSESVWLRDYITMFNSNSLVPGTNISREKCLKALAICAIQGCIDYGFEIARIFYELRLLTRVELESLEKKSAWKLGGHTEPQSQNKYLNVILRLFPTSFRSQLGREANIAMKQPHIFKRPNLEQE
jgi:FkbM family methyltransferase